MSKFKRKVRKINAALCRGCNQWRRPNRVKMVDPRIIGIDKPPIALCAKCRSRLVWKPVEKLPEKPVPKGLVKCSTPTVEPVVPQTELSSLVDDYVKENEDV